MAFANSDFIERIKWISIEIFNGGLQGFRFVNNGQNPTDEESSFKLIPLKYNEISGILS